MCQAEDGIGSTEINTIQALLPRRLQPIGRVRPGYNDSRTRQMIRL